MTLGGKTLLRVLYLFAGVHRQADIGGWLEAMVEEWNSDGTRTPMQLELTQLDTLRGGANHNLLPKQKQAEESRGKTESKEMSMQFGTGRRAWIEMLLAGLIAIGLATGCGDGVSALKAPRSTPLGEKTSICGSELGKPESVVSVISAVSPIRASKV